MRNVPVISPLKLRAPASTIQQRPALLSRVRAGCVRRCEFHAGREAVEEAHFELAFERLDLPTYRGWLKCKRSAARVRCPSSATAKNVRSWYSSIVWAFSGVFTASFADAEK